MNDPVLETLCLPLADSTIEWPDDGPALFLRARTGEALRKMPRGKLLCEQGFKPAHDALARDGFAVGDGDATYGLTLVLPPRQREEGRALLVRAIRATRQGGMVMAAVSNLEGAKTVENDLKRLAGSVGAVSKNKCRVFWARIDADALDQAQMTAWEHEDAPRSIVDGFVSRPGLFAWDHIDAGSQLLIDTLPQGLKGRAADLGAGFGYLSHAVLTRNPGITHIDLIEAEARALEMARHNMRAFGDRASGYWLDATTALPGAYDLIVSNPPFHIDRQDRNDLGQAFIRSAARALNAGGSFWMVANRHLPYEETLKACFRSVETAAQTNAFKVFHAKGVKA